jgi:uncharacterized protein YqeY
LTGNDAENLRERLSRALPVAMKARDRVAVAALRSALAAIANAEAVDPSRAPPPGPSSPTGPPPEPGGSAPDPPFAGTVAGLGATEVERRRLSGTQVEEVVRAEVADREAVAAGYERAGLLEQAERLRGEAQVLASHLERT